MLRYIMLKRDLAWQLNIYDCRMGIHEESRSFIVKPQFPAQIVNFPIDESGSTEIIL